jgi:hypothetical protein
MLRAFASLLLFSLALAQSQATLTQPPQIETNTYTLRSVSKKITALSTDITYMQNYTNSPQVWVSIVSLSSFISPSTVNYSMSVTSITLAKFTVEYTISCLSLGSNCTFSLIVIDYLVFDYSTYPFVQIFDSFFTLDPTAVLNDQFYEI